MFYKWLVQVTVCLHWFNPFVHLMNQEIIRACEFSCDEAVLAKMGSNSAQDYGKTLLDAMAAVGRYKENLGAVTLSENKQLLKERINAIMDFKKKSTAIRLLTGALTLCVMFGAAFVGVYPVAAAVDRTASKPQAAVDKTPAQGNTGTSSKDYATQAERYYEADSLPLFEITFPRLDENTQKKWLEKFYADGDVAFFSVAVRQLDTNSTLFAGFAEKAYADEETAFFSTLTDCMDEAELELWLDRALEDGNWAFQSMLFDKLNRGEEFDELEEKQEKKWAEAQTAEYRAVGVTMDGKDYYYQGQLVNIFLDIRPNKSGYTLNMNPKGIVNIKIVRDAENKITGVSYMTEAEVAEVLEDGKTSSPVATSNGQPAKTDVSPSSQRGEDRENKFDWDWDDEKDKKWDETRRAEYQAVGVTIDGKNYYYQGQLVNIFMDVRANKSFYVLDTNPVGTVNIKIIRDANNNITGVTYMTDADVAELLEDMA
jgi:hypothetical protein